MGRPRKTGEKEENMRKRKKKVHDPKVIAKAIESVKTGQMTQRQAAKTFEIPFSTLNDKIVGKTPVAPRKKVSLLLPEEEDELVKHLLDRAKCGLVLTTVDIRRTAQAIIDLRRPPEKDNKNVNMPSVTWVYRLFERHPELTVKSIVGLGKKRATVTPQAISKWFKELREYIVAMDPSLLEDGSRIYNADESGFAFDVKVRKVTALKGSKRVYNVTSNKKTQVTVLACMSAIGHYLPPVMVYPYKRLPQKDLANGFPGAVIQASDNGWMTAAIFFTWLQDSFIPNTKHVKKPLLLLVDGHTSHTSLIETSILCQENGIILYSFVAHASHLIQPLDQAFSRSIKPAWAQATRHHIDNCGNAVNLDNFASVLKPIWDKSATPEIAAESFRAAGIVPFDPNRVLNSGKLAPCAVFRTAQAPFLPEEPEPLGSPSATSLPEKPEPLDFPSATSLPEKLEPLDFPSATSLPEKLEPLDFPSATSLPEKLEPLDFPSATSLPEKLEPLDSPSATSLPEEPVPPSSPSATSLPEDVATPASSFASSVAGESLPLPTPSGSSDPSSDLLTLTVQQLEAIKEFGIFLYDDLLRKKFIRFFSVLEGTETAPSDDSFNIFQERVVKIVNAFTPATSTLPEQTPIKARLTAHDILQIPKFNGTKKKGKKLTPTIPDFISSSRSEDLSGAIKRKLESKQKEEEAKLAKKTMREENKRK